MASYAFSRDGEYLRKLSNGKIQNQFRGNGPFVDATETFYSEFSLAWRFLGFYTDCDVCVEGAGDEDNGDDDANKAEEDGEDENFVSSSGCLENGEDRTVCRRYALWAAYIDQAYEGDGASEYQHFDHRTKRWDRSACNSSEGRCAKLDCHNPSSKNFKLIGVFKDPKIDAFIDNVIDYQGDCVWSDDEYKFMKAMTSSYNEKNDENNDYTLNFSGPPTTCTPYQVKGEDGITYSGYYDAIPISKGNMGVALYTDSECTESYAGKTHSVEDVMARSMGSTSSVIERKLKSWNEAMDALKVCQPCVAYSTLGNSSMQPYNANGDRYSIDNENGDDGDNFVCRDNLERDEPVNQCEVFAEQGRDSMRVATYRDILLAESQGTVTGIDLSSYSSNRRGKMVLGHTFVQPNHIWFSVFFFLLSMGFFGYALVQLFEKDRSKHRSNSKNMNEPLVGMEITSKKNKKENIGAGREQKSAEKAQRKAKLGKQDQEQKKKLPKKSILKKPKKLDEEDDDSHSYRHFGDDSSFGTKQ